MCQLLIAAVCAIDISYDYMCIVVIDDSLIRKKIYQMVVT